MGTSDGSVIGAAKILDHGSDSLRWNMVLVAEGYRAAEMAQFHTDSLNFVNTLITTAPFDALQAAINVHRLDVTSTDSGADDPVACGGSGATPATYFDASFCNSGIRRLLLVNNANVISTVNANVPGWSMILVLVNSGIYGGAGGTIATMSMHPSAVEIGLHEMGHTAFGLADEYEYWAGCASGETGHNNHPASEPSQPNVTIDSNRATIKWGDLILASTPMPTTTNANCAQCDPQGNPFAAETVGAYEGAHYYHCGAFRPQFNCRMRALGHPFCAVCRRRINQVLSPHLPKAIFKELKDFKFEKIEKIEKSEKIEKVEFKEKIERIEKIVFEGPKVKDAEFEPWRQFDIFERLTRLEASVERLSHFIGIQQRPDLGRGALMAEPDVAPSAPKADERGGAAGTEPGRGRGQRRGSGQGRRGRRGRKRRSP